MASPMRRDIEWAERRCGRFTASLAAAISVLRGLPLLVSARPGSPLRVLCVMAFDTVYVLRKSRRLTSQSLRVLAALLDLGACVNDYFDNDNFSREEYRTTRRMIARDSKCVPVNEYLRRLRDIELRRPSPGGDNWQHRKAQSYRESVVRLSLGTVAATALDSLAIWEGVELTHNDEDIEMLYRIVMLCQIIDDVLDFPADACGGLPTFLTAHASPSRALALTSDAAKRYADVGSPPRSPHVFPFRFALRAVSALTRLTIMFGRRRLQKPPAPPQERCPTRQRSARPRLREKVAQGRMRGVVIIHD